MMAGNAQYILHINSDDRQRISSVTKKFNLFGKSDEPKIVKRFVNWKFYKGKLTSEKRLHIAV